MSVELTDEQQLAVKTVVDWLENRTMLGKQIFKLGGFAGTGKTTVIKAIESAVNQQPGVCAFTGKAASVLRKKGLYDAQTMHSLMYDPREEKGEVIFVKKYELDQDYIIVDEASMVSTDLNNDLLSYGKKVLYVGDPGQLEPVGDNPGLMNSPDFTLTKIHRQAEESPIIRASLKVRNNEQLTYGVDGEYSVVTRASLAFENALSVDQVICAYNAARIDMNKKIRGLRGFQGLPNEGEKVICLRNDRQFGVYNGQLLKVIKIHGVFDSRLFTDLEDDLGVVRRRIPILVAGLEGRFDPKTQKLPFRTTWFDYGYAITCHKSQGSEWDSVLVFEQYSKLWSMNRWRYTAITRAAKRLIYVK